MGLGCELQIDENNDQSHGSSREIPSGVDQSQSDPNNEETNATNTNQSFCSDLQQFFSFDNNNDAKGCALVKFPEAASWVASSIYLSTILVKYAYLQAGCVTEIPEGEIELPECHNRVYGFKPSSMLSIFILILGVTTAIFLPFVGAMMDLSNHRRAVGAATGFILCIITFIQSFVSQHIWFPIFVLQLVSSVMLTINGCVALAYLPELTDDKPKLARYNTLTQLSFNVTVVIYLVGMTIVSSLLNTSNNELESARIALLTTFVIQVFCYGISWIRLFSPRKARAMKRSQDVDEDGDEGTYHRQKCSFVRDSMGSLRETIVKAFKQRPEVRYFLFYRALTFPANAAMMAAIVSYVNQQIQISSRDLGIATLIILAFAIPGNKLSLVLMSKMDPLRSLRICMLFTIVLPPAIALLVSRPGHEWRLFVIAIAWGLILGWKEPSDKTTLCSLIPHGVEAEMMGLYMGCGQILMWMSPLLFTLMNESGLNIRVAIATFGAYPLLGFVSLMLMGTFANVVVSTQSHEKESMIEMQMSMKKKPTRRVKSEGDLHSHTSSLDSSSGRVRGSLGHGYHNSSRTSISSY